MQISFKVELFLIMDDEKDFLIVLPSNCQPNIFTQNTASSFSMQLEHPKSLDGQWEVALKDLCFVNTMQTLENEKINVSRVTTRTIDEHTWFNVHLENQQIVIPFDLRQHSAEWESALKSITLREQRKRALIPIILAIMNRYMSHSFWWTYIKDRVYIRYIRKGLSPPQEHYGFFFSKHLMEVFNLHSQLIFPTDKGFVLHRDLIDVNNMETYDYRGLSSDVGEDYTLTTDVQNDRALTLAILPLHRMQRKTITIPKCKNVSALVSELNEKLGHYGLIASVNIAEKTNVVIQSRMSFDNDDHAVFISIPQFIFNHQIRNHRFLCGLDNTYTFIHVRRGAIPQFHVEVYLKKLKQRKTVSSHKSLCDLHLSTKYYKNERQLLTVLNEQRNDKNLKFDFTFTFNDEWRRFQLEVKDGLILRISKVLQSILGFDVNVFNEGKHIASRIPLLHRNIHYFYLYTNIIQPIYVGGDRVPLLRYIPIPNADYGETVYKEFLNPNYLPVCINQLQRIDIGLYDDTGEKIQFEEGRTVATLHFRKRNYV